jgi:hypothetical protein
VSNGVAPGKCSAVTPTTFAGGHILPSAWHPAKAAPEAFICRVPLGLAPGKDFLCRVPDKKHPANDFAPGKSAASCSGVHFSPSSVSSWPSLYSPHSYWLAFSSSPPILHHCHSCFMRERKGDECQGRVSVTNENQVFLMSNYQQ